MNIFHFAFHYIPRRYFFRKQRAVINSSWNLEITKPKILIYPPLFRCLPAGEKFPLISVHFISKHFFPISAQSEPCRCT